MNAAVLLAGGNGSRVKYTSIPKQYIAVNGKKIIEYTIEAYQKSEDIDSIVLVVNKSHMKYVSDVMRKYSKIIKIVQGGHTRIESVLNAVLFLENICKNSDKIIISDAVRPLIFERDIKNITFELNNYECVAMGIRCYETLFKSDSKMETKAIINRENLFRQTSPEGYRYSVLKYLYINIPKDIINSYKNIGFDQMIVLGKKVKIIASNSFNFKITTYEDIEIFKTIILSGVFERMQELECNLTDSCFDVQ